MTIRTSNGIFKWGTYLCGAFLCIVLFTRCAGPDINAHKQRLPELDLFTFFQGKTVAFGIFEDRFGQMRRQFRVEIDGTISKDMLQLDERFLYDDGETDRRIWHITKQTKGSGMTSFTGQAEDVAGTASGQLSGNTFRWRYDIDLVLSGNEMRVHFDDFIYQIDKDIAINRAYVSKWGIEVGSVTLVFLKQELAQSLIPLDLKNW